MNDNNLVERLTLQSESFQEGFETLCSASDFEEMVKDFLHLIRGNFIVSNVCAFHRKNTDSNWKPISSNKNDGIEILNLFNNINQTKINFHENDKYSVSLLLTLSDSSQLAILVGNKMDQSEFSDFDKITLQVLIQVFDSAHRTSINQKKEKTLIFDLNEKIAQMSNLIDTLIDISRFDKKDVLFESAIERIASLTCASAAMVQITFKGMLQKEITFPYNIKADEVLNSIYKIDSEFIFNETTYKFVLAEKESRHGINDFNDLDKLLLSTITKQINNAIENEFLNQQRVEKEKIQQELIVAASIQQKILPESLPKINGYDLAGINIPSREVGGDYYNCVDLGDGKFALIIADVAGKGISAALLVSTLDAALYSYLQFDITLTELADRLNKLIYKSSPSDKYITFFIIVLNSQTGELDILNAGHNPSLLLRKDGTLEKLGAGGVGLGMFDFGIPFSGQKSILYPGDKLFLYTDGIPEAMNDAEQEYTDERMIHYFQNYSQLSSHEFIINLVQDVKTHTRTAPQSDDITALMIKRN